MIRTAVSFILCALFSGVASGQSYKGQFSLSSAPVLSPHFEDEYTFDKPVDPARWTKEKAGMHAAFGSTDKLYFRVEAPDLSPEKTALEETGWRGERLNAQIVVWSPDTIRQVHFTISDLKSASGQVLSKENLQLRMVRYIVSNYPYGASDVTCAPTPYKDVYLMPDRFEAFDRFDVPGKSVRPVWLTIELPAGQQPGSYTGTIDVTAVNYKTTLTLRVNVQAQTLPAPSEWKYRLDLWQNPWVVAWRNGLTPWSAEHKALLKQHLAWYANMGGKYITTYAVHSPWADNSYSIEGGMIEWIKKSNGSWSFDYAIFDEYVELCMEVGIKEAITLYTPIPWGNRFRYKDEKTGIYIYEAWEPGTEKFKQHWDMFLTDLKSHLEKKGWFNKTYLGINENTMEQTLAAIKVIKAHSDKWRITYAGDWHKELDLLLDDYCYLYGKEPSLAEQKARSARGVTSTYYVCCNPPKPNNFVFSPPVEGRWISWYSAAYGYDGFLRWAYDAWPEDPVRDARHGSWAAGDCFLIYPGANSCIRLEKLREGIVDYEKIRILREQATKSSDKNVKKLLQDLDTHLKVFTQERDFNEAKITADVDKGKLLLKQLSESLKK